MAQRPVAAGRSQARWHSGGTASFAAAPGEPRYGGRGIGLNLLPVLTEGLRTPPACLREVDAALTAPRPWRASPRHLVQAPLAFAEAGFAPFRRAFAQRDLLAGRAVTLSDGTQGQAMA